MPRRGVSSFTPTPRANGTTITYSGHTSAPDHRRVAGAAPDDDRDRLVPEITWHRSGSARYHVQVHDAQGPFVLALGDAYSRDWHVHGLPAGAKAVPIEIDGYRNGWAIDARGDMKLTVEYTPARVGHAAIRVSQLGLLALLATLPSRGCGASAAAAPTNACAGPTATGPRRVQVPDAWLLPADRGASDPRGHNPVITL